LFLFDERQSHKHYIEIDHQQTQTIQKHVKAEQCVQYTKTTCNQKAHLALKSADTIVVRNY